MPNALVSKADAEDGNSLCIGLDNITGKPRMFRSHWSGRNDNMRYAHLFQIAGLYFIIPLDYNRIIISAKPLPYVIHKGIVIVQNQNHAVRIICFVL